MRYLIRSIVTIAVLAGVASAAPLPDDQNSIVIVFKDGHQQTYSMSEIARIEFRTPNPMEGGRGKFLGRWKVGDGAGGNFFITLDASGEAKKTAGSSHGRWTVVNNEARITWDDGWHDAIRKVGNRYEKVAFSPERSFNDPPSNITNAENLEPQAN